jgi:hypothetical protein
MEIPCEIGYHIISRNIFSSISILSDQTIEYLVSEVQDLPNGEASVSLDI